MDNRVPGEGEPGSLWENIPPAQRLVGTRVSHYFRIPRKSSSEWNDVRKQLFYLVIEIEIPG